ncbi:hypothetical protein M438DRAFT_346929 [Aureobasidium pullulans EXF-150]|uniref:Large ribosomal subunit protein mL50 n=1 Tax=Aureobasidium pullulans EXF-150 TaxID=1043002 RepID=A0A074Y738_AURPU|nr:uncharacterized protein M438DRAFT_346929 [Aureobasidium pullulans EXF-150]KEQ82671.1 hypothetical protein M438DRAFT_346929 [Aureobasidium pullulans EXF-150]
MSRISTFGRAVSQLATPSTSSSTCRSCQLRISAASQQRQLQTSAARPAFVDRFKSVFRGKKEEESTDVTTASATEALDPSDRQPEFPGWYLPKEDIPEGWAKTPQDDSAYVVATEGKDLEHVGSEKWLELQFDDKPNYKGWSKVKKANGLSPRDAGARVIEAAKKVGLGEARLQQLEQEGLAFEVNDVQTKFKLTKNLRTATNMQIPDIIMHRATTLKDFQQAILSKPKPKKLSKDLLANSELMANPNLQVRGRRQTPIHKERAVGRWKVIEEELVNRGLPVFGHGIKADRGISRDDQAA